MTEGSTEIVLRLLGTDVVLTTPDRQWYELLRRLWEPFARSETPAHAIRAEVAEGPEGWEFRIPDRVRLVSRDAWLLTNEIRHALSELALERAPEVVDLHAAAVAHAGRGVLIAGPSEAGKTSLALAFARRGWALLGDDVAPVEEKSIRLLPFPTPVGIKDPTRFAELAGAAGLPPEWPPVPEGTFLVPATTFGAPAPGDVPRVDPQFLVFAAFRPGAEGGLTEVSPGRAVMRCGELTRRMDSKAIALIARLCEQVHAVDLVYGSSDGGIDLLQGGLADFPRTSV